MIDLLQVRRDVDGSLLVTGHGLVDVPVVVSLAFPLTEPERWISLRTRQGHEVAFSETLEGFGEAAAPLIREELQTRLLIPRIVRIRKAASTSSGLQIDVDTDRGPTTLMLDADDKIRRLSDHRIVLTDKTGFRYLIEDASQLDTASRHRLERFY